MYIHTRFRGDHAWRGEIKHAFNISVFHFPPTGKRRTPRRGRDAGLQSVAAGLYTGLRSQTRIKPSSGPNLPFNGVCFPNAIQSRTLHNPHSGVARGVCVEETLPSTAKGEDFVYIALIMCRWRSIVNSHYQHSPQNWSSCLSLKVIAIKCFLLKSVLCEID